MSFIAAVLLHVSCRLLLQLVSVMVAWRHGWPDNHDDVFNETSRRLDELRLRLYTDPCRYSPHAHQHQITNPAAGIPMPNLLGLKIHNPDDDRSSS